MRNRCRPGQAFARAIIELKELLIKRGCSVTIRWTIRGMEENEVAESYARWAADSPHGSVGREYLQEAALA